MSGSACVSVVCSACNKDLYCSVFGLSQTCTMFVGASLVCDLLGQTDCGGQSLKLQPSFLMTADCSTDSVQSHNISCTRLDCQCLWAAYCMAGCKPGYEPFDRIEGVVLIVYALDSNHLMFYVCGRSETNMFFSK